MPGKKSKIINDTDTKVNNNMSVTSDKIESEVINEEDNLINSDEVVTNAYVDRIETVEKGVDKAVLYFGDDDGESEPEKVIMPVSMLPESVKADDTLEIKIKIAQ